MNKKLVIWCFYDDAGRSYWNALKDNPRYEVYSFGINDRDDENYYKMDLSLTNPNLISDLKKLPQPDLLLASPPCTAFSITNPCRAYNVENVDVNGIPTNFIFTLKSKRDIDRYSKKAQPRAKRDYFKTMKEFINGISCANGLMYVIRELGIRHYIIENPKSSFLWKYLFNVIPIWDLNALNHTYYSAYNSNYPHKPTSFFYSRTWVLPIFGGLMDGLDLKTEKGETNVRTDMLGKTQRSDIPPELVRHIVSVVEEYINEEKDNN